MKYNTLDTIIDDIMLEMRRNNITESETYSRKQIEQWLIQYRLLMLKELSNAKLPIPDSYFQRFITELTQGKKNNLGGMGIYDMVSKIKIPDYFCSNIGDRFITSYDMFGNEIQVMSEKRSRGNSNSRHFYNAKPTAYIGTDRKYHADNTDGVNIVEIGGIFVNPTEVPFFDYKNDMYPLDPGELPKIKQLIFQGELKFNLMPDVRNDGKEFVQTTAK